MKKFLHILAGLALCVGLFVLFFTFSGKGGLQMAGNESSASAVKASEGPPVEQGFAPEKASEGPPVEQGFASEKASEGPAVEQGFEPESPQTAFSVPEGGWTEESLSAAIAKTVEIKDDGSRLIISCCQPEIPEEFHFTFSVDIFDQSGKTVDRFVSDAGWLAHPENYNPLARTITALMNEPTLEGRFACILVKVGDKNLREGAQVCQLTVNYDGSMVWESGKLQAK